jgi:hypothetical protein
MGKGNHRRRSAPKWKFRFVAMVSLFSVITLYFSIVAKPIVPATLRVQHAVDRAPQSIEASFTSLPDTNFAPNLVVLEQRSWLNRLAVGVTNAGIFTGNAVTFPIRIYLFRGGLGSDGDSRSRFEYISYVK